MKHLSEPIRLPKLAGISPTLFSTLLKGVEEAGELSREVLLFLKSEPEEAEFILNRIAEELLDVAQTCVTMIFVFEKDEGIVADDLVTEHLGKLKRKGYRFSDSEDYTVATEGNWKLLKLPKLDLPEVDLLLTVAKIQEEFGELTQLLGKGTGASGEAKELQKSTAYEEAALELLDIAQCCFTMMYLLEERHNLELEIVLQAHIEKLVSRGYCEPLKQDEKH